MQLNPHARFLYVVLGNETGRELTDRLAELDLPDAYLAAGCLSQTVWNHVSGFRGTVPLDDAGTEPATPEVVPEEERQPHGHAYYDGPGHSILSQGREQGQQRGPGEAPRPTRSPA